MSAIDPATQSSRKCEAYKHLHILRENNTQIHLPRFEPIDVMQIVQEQAANGKSTAYDFRLDNIVEKTMRDSQPVLPSGFIPFVEFFVLCFLNGFRVRFCYPKPYSDDDWKKLTAKVNDEMKTDFALAKIAYRQYKHLGLVQDVIDAINYISGVSAVSGGITTSTRCMSAALGDVKKMRRYLIVSIVDESLREASLAPLKSLIDQFQNLPNFWSAKITPISEIYQKGKVQFVAHWVSKWQQELDAIRSLSESPPIKAKTSPKLFFSDRRGYTNGIFEMDQGQESLLEPARDASGLWRVSTVKSETPVIIRVKAFISPLPTELKPWIRMAADFEKKRDPNKMYIFASQDAEPTNPAVILYHLLNDA